MLRLALVSIFKYSASGHNWGLDQCIGPAHGPIGSKAGPSPEGFKISVRDASALEITSDTPILGFLIYGALSFNNPPPNSEISAICGHPNGSVSHTSSIPRKDFSIEYICPEGVDRVEIKGYIVFGYSRNQARFRGYAPCEQPGTAKALETTIAPV
jgi:hypothetical protein